MVLQIISWYKYFVRRIDGLTKTSKLQLETRPTITAIALLINDLVKISILCPCFEVETGGGGEDGERAALRGDGTVQYAGPFRSWGEIVRTQCTEVSARVLVSPGTC